MHFFPAILKLLCATLLLLFGMLACAFSGAMGAENFSKLAVRWNAWVAFCLRVHVRAAGDAPAQNALILSNHISWLDTVVIGAHWRVTFLAESGIAKWPALGYLVRKSGVLFIERGRGAQKALADLSAALGAGRRVVLFPEGRTGDGIGVRRFHPRLLQAAEDAGAPLQPLALRYRDSAGARVTRHSFAGRTFLRSLWNCVYGPAITAEIRVFPPLPRGERGELARRAEELVRAEVE